MKDGQPLIAGIFGALATIPYEIFTRILVALNIGKYSAYELTSLIITLNRPEAILGGVVSFTLGGVFAIAFYYSLEKLGSDYVIFKSMGLSLFIWVTIEAIYVWLVEGPGLVDPRPLDDYYIHMFGSFIYGLTLGLLFYKYLTTTTE